MLIINRLKSMANFSNSESKIAEFIVADPTHVLNLTIHELADLTYTSASTVTRLCQKLGTDGFSSFKIQLARELNASGGERIEDNQPFDPGQSTEEIISRMRNLTIQSINDTYNHIDHKQLERVALMIQKASNRYIYGTGQSLIQAQDFQYKLLSVGINCDVESKVGFRSMKARAQPADSLGIIISYYGKGYENRYIQKALISNGIPYILFTGPDKNFLCDDAIEVIHVPPQESLVSKMAAFSSRNAIQLALDFVFALIFSLDYENNLIMKSQRSQFNKDIEKGHE